MGSGAGRKGKLSNANWSTWWVGSAASCIQSSMQINADFACIQGICTHVNSTYAVVCTYHYFSDTMSTSTCRVVHIHVY